MDNRRPAARHGDRAARQRPRVADPAARRFRRHGDAGDLGAPGRAEHGVVVEDLDAGSRGEFAFPSDLVARPVVDDRHEQAVRLRVERRLVRRCPVGRDHDVAPRRHRVAVHVAAKRVRQHDPGPVVVGEYQRPFMRAGRNDHLAGTDLPKPLSRLAGRRLAKMVGQPLAERDVIVVEMPEDGRPRQDPHVLPAAQFLERARHPRPRGEAVDRRGRVVQEAPAGPVLLVGQYDALARCRCGEGGGQPRRSATGDQHIGMNVGMNVVIRVGRRRCRPEARRAPDEGLVDLRPGLGRPHERLVVEAGREQRRGDVVENADIHAQ